jgi:hypothetical protein
MTDIKSYLEDGANWQAQAVLACVRHYTESCFDSDEEDKAVVLVGRYENCREQGYIITLTRNRCQSLMSYCVYEHRNSDSICVQMFHANFMNAPSIDDVFYGKRDKWDIDKRFDCGNIYDCALFIVKDMATRWEEFVRNKQEHDRYYAITRLNEEAEKWRKEAEARDEEYKKERK